MKRRLTLIVLLALLVSSFGTVMTTSGQDDVSLLIWADETRAAVIEELGPTFEEEYGVSLEVQQVAFGDIRDQLKVQGPAGEGPDVIIGAHDWLGELVTNSLISPIDLGEDAANFDPIALQAFTYDGQLYGVPYAVESIALFYNTELVAEPPATWAEVRTISEEIIAADPEMYGFVRQDGDPFHFYPIQTSFGGYVFGENEDGSYNPEDVGIDSEGSIAALQWVVDMINDGVMPSGLDGGTAQTLFQDGQAAMYITGPWNIDAFTTAGVPFAIAPIPAAEEGGAPGAPFVGVQGFMINSFSEQTDLAKVFLTEFVASEEVQTALYEAGNRPSALLSVQEKIDDPNIAAILAVVQTGKLMPSNPEMSAVWSAWGDAVANAMIGSESPSDAFAAAATTIRETIAGE